MSGKVWYRRNDRKQKEYMWRKAGNDITGGCRFYYKRGNSSCAARRGSKEGFIGKSIWAGQVVSGGGR